MRDEAKTWDNHSGAVAGGDGRGDAHALSGRVADLVQEAVFEYDSEWRVRSVNRAFLELFCTEPGTAPLGLRFCEVLGCVHAEREGASCGCAPACALCGWLRASTDAQRGLRSEQECRVLSRSGHAYDLSLRASCEDGRGLCAAKDLYAAKRLRVLERTFFHDVMNHAVGIKGLSELVDLADAEQVEEYMRLIQDSASRMVETILWLRTLRSAEQGSLVPCVTQVVAAELIREVVSRFSEEIESRHVDVAITCDEGVALETDREVARLVLERLLLNAIEASRRGDRVGVACVTDGTSAVFRVSSMQPMPQDTPAQVFQRSFSTKGEGRGVGTYGAKRMGERVLGGEVWCETHETMGTVFGVRLPLVWRPTSPGSGK